MRCTNVQVLKMIETKNNQTGQMIRILVTGGAGYIGSHIVKLLIQKKYEVIVIDNLVKGHKRAINDKARFYEVDLSNKQDIIKVLENNKIDCVIHLAGFIEAGESMTNPSKYFNNNVTNTLNLLDAMIKVGVLNIIFSSTAAVYGNPKYLPINEKHPKKPTNYYGLSKLMIEKVLETYNKAYGLQFIALRYFNAGGADDSGLIGENHDPETHLIPIVLEAAKGTREKVFIFGNDYDTKDGSCVRDYIHVNDLAEAHIAAMENLEKIQADYFNLGNGTGFSVLEIINHCKTITGKEIKVEMAERRPGDPDTLIADYSKAKELLGWKPKYSIQTIIETAWNWQNK